LLLNVEYDAARKIREVLLKGRRMMCKNARFPELIMPRHDTGGDKLIPVYKY